MALVAAKCTECGASIEVDNSKEAGICRFCGTAFVTERIIHQYITNVYNYTGNNSSPAPSSLQTLLDAVNNYKRLGDYPSVVKTYKQMTEKFPGEFTGWWGLACDEISTKMATNEALSQNMFHFSESARKGFGERIKAYEDRIREIRSFKSEALENAKKLANPQQANEIRAKLEELKQNMATQSASAKSAIEELKKERAAFISHFQSEFPTHHAFYQFVQKYNINGKAKYDWQVFTLEKYYPNKVCLSCKRKDGLIRTYSLSFETYDFDYSDLSFKVQRENECVEIVITPPDVGELKERDITNYHKVYIDNFVNNELILHIEPLVANYISENGHKPDEFVTLTLTPKVAGCYVATSVYGSYDCPEVWTLRRFRDYTLDETWYGRLFIKCYYAISPTLVKWFGKTAWFQNFWKKRLDKMVASLKKKGYEDTPYNDKY